MSESNSSMAEDSQEGTSPENSHEGTPSEEELSDEEPSDEEPSDQEPSDEETSDGEPFDERPSDRDPSDEEFRPISSDLLTCINDVSVNYSFGVFNELENVPIAGLTVQDVGTVGFPVSERDTKALIDASRRAPFGKGTETIIDERVRKTWEIDAKALSFRNKNWNAFIDEQVKKVANQMGVKEDVKAELYKLLIYEDGAMFKPHKDTEKTPGMFGTLVVCLPSLHEGGDLHLRHGKQKHVFKTSERSEFGFSCLAWYADVIHEVKPVTSGYRIVLTYNLVKQYHDYGALPTAVGLDDKVGRLRQVLADWNQEVTAGLPTAIWQVYLLKHEYTEESLCLQTLKGIDRRRADLVHAACQQSDFHLFLANLEREVSGGCEEEGWGPYGWGGRSSYKLVDEEENHLELSHVVDVNGSLKLEKVKIDRDDIVQSKPFEDRDPDDEEHEGWTGNEGAYATQWYRNTALVLVPKSEYISLTFKPKMDNGENIKAAIDKMRDEFVVSASRDNERRDNLFRVCKLVLEQNATKLPNRIFGGYASSESLPAETLGAIAHSCVALSDQYMLDKSIDQARNGMTMITFFNLGSAMSRTQWPTFKSSIENAVKKHGKIWDRIEAVEQFRQGFLQASMPDGQGEAKDAAECESDVTLDSWTRQMIHDALLLAPSSAEDGIALVGVAVRFGADILQTHIIPFVNEHKHNSPFAIAFLTQLVRSEERCSPTAAEGFFKLSNEAIEDTFKSLAEGVVTEFDRLRCHYTLEQPKSGYYHKTEVAPTRQDLKQADERAERTAMFYGDCLQRERFSAAQAILEKICSQTEQIGAEQFGLIWLPFLRHLAEQHSKLQRPFSDEIVQRLFTELMINYLGNAVRMEPEKPKDWAREPSREVLRCDCPECRELKAFLVDPSQQVGRFKKNEKLRKHLEYNLWDKNGMSCETERGKAPYTLVMTKNNEPYFKSKSEWDYRVRNANTEFSKFDRTVLQEALGERFEEIMSMRMIKLSAQSSSTKMRSPENRQPPSFESSWPSNNYVGPPANAFSSLPPLQNASASRQNQQTLPGLHEVAGAKPLTAPQKRKVAEVVDLTDD